MTTRIGFDGGKTEDARHGRPQMVTATRDAGRRNVLRERVVPEAGLEPARPEGREILSLLCLPIPPPGQDEDGTM
jgi:hypothetical protein